MAKKTTKKTTKKTRRKKAAPLSVGGAAGSAAAGDREAKLARLEEDLLAAIQDAEAMLKKLRDRLEELRAERTAPEPVATLAAADPVMGPTSILWD